MLCKVIKFVENLILMGLKILDTAGHTNWSPLRDDSQNIRFEWYGFKLI